MMKTYPITDCTLNEVYQREFRSATGPYLMDEEHRYVCFNPIGLRWQPGFHDAVLHHTLQSKLTRLQCGDLTEKDIEEKMKKRFSSLLHAKVNLFSSRENPLRIIDIPFCAKRTYLCVGPVEVGRHDSDTEYIDLFVCGRDLLGVQDPSEILSKKNLNKIFKYFKKSLAGIIATPCQPTLERYLPREIATRLIKASDKFSVPFILDERETFPYKTSNALYAQTIGIKPDVILCGGLYYNDKRYFTTIYKRSVYAKALEDHLKRTQKKESEPALILLSESVYQTMADQERREERDSCAKSLSKKLKALQANTEMFTYWRDGGQFYLDFKSPVLTNRIEAYLDSKGLLLARDHLAPSLLTINLPLSIDRDSCEILVDTMEKFFRLHLPMEKRVR